MGIGCLRVIVILYAVCMKHGFAAICKLYKKGIGRNIQCEATFFFSA